jgi:hypothetical protein
LVQAKIGNAILAATTPSGILLVQVAAEQGSADATSNRTNGSAANCMSDKGTTHAATDGSNCTITATTSTTIMVCVTAIPVMTRERSIRHHSSYGNQSRQGGCCKLDFHSKLLREFEL